MQKERLTKYAKCSDILKSLADTHICLWEDCTLGGVKIVDMLDRLFELEDAIEQGELVSKEWHDEQIGHAELVIEEYQSKIENGTLIELPCKVGDTVYHLSDKKILEEIVKQIKYIINDGKIDLLNSYIMTDDIYSKDYNFYRLSKLGKSLFYTKAEAEAKLKELSKC